MTDRCPPEMSFKERWESFFALSDKCAGVYIETAYDGCGNTPYRTLIFLGGDDVHIRCYETEDEARAGHEQAVKLVSDAANEFPRHA